MSEGTNVSLLWVVGLVLAFILIGASLAGAGPLINIIKPRADVPSLESLNFLEIEIKRLQEGEEQEVPYYLHEEYVLISDGVNCPENQLCLCKGDASCSTFVKEGRTNPFVGITFVMDPISGTTTFGERGVKNVHIRKGSGKVWIRE